MDSAHERKEGNKEGRSIPAIASVRLTISSIRWSAALIKLDVGRDERLAWLSYSLIILLL